MSGGSRRRRLLTVAALTASAAVPLGFAGTTPAGGASLALARASSVATTPISHVIIVLKENRSFDEYFGSMPGVDGQTFGRKADGTTVSPLPQTPDPLPNDINHSPGSFTRGCDADSTGTCRNDGFDQVKGAYSSTGQPLALSQMSASQIPDYRAWANTYGIADKFFASWKGASFTNNLYEFAGQAGRYDTTTGCVANAAVANTQACHTGGRSVSGLPKPPPGSGGLNHHWGCDDPAGTLTQLMNPATGGTTTMYPCYRFKSLPDELTAAGVSWKSYANSISGFHEALDAIDSIRNDPTEWAKVQPEGNFTLDVKAGNLANVSWIVPRWTDHPPQPACNGENELVNLVGAVQSSPYWKSTAIVVLWDEWGGFYDHVPPPNVYNPISGDRISFGFRVPALVISPWVKAGKLANGGYVSSQFYSHASLLKFIEHDFNVPSLGADDAQPDSMTGGDLMDFFDFSGAQTGTPPHGTLNLSTRSCKVMTAAEQRLVATSDPD
jgi:phospholipase C